ncbi:hypothetical protein ACQJBY_023235 [Aegilops geniculata]
MAKKTFVPVPRCCPAGQCLGALQCLHFCCLLQSFATRSATSTCPASSLRPAAATTSTASINPGSFDIWMDRCSLIDYDDGLINTTCHSIDITVSMSFCCLSLLPSHSMLGFSQQISLITLDIVMYW